MKEEELGESAKRTELFLRPRFEGGEAKRFSLFWKVELAEEAINPDIDGKGIEPAIGVEKDAAGDFRAHPRKFFQVLGSLLGGPGRGNFEPMRLAHDHLGGGGEMFGAVPEGTFSKGKFARFGEAGGRGEALVGAAEGGAKASMDLANMGDLFEGGADEVDQALPRVLAEGAKSRVELDGSSEVGVCREVGLEEGGKIEVEGEVVMDLRGGQGWVIPV